MVNRRVLLIDDDIVVTSVYETYFRDAGFTVTVANDGGDGLRALHDARPDAVLLDLSMPNLNGIQWLQQSRNDPRFRNLPVVVLTSGTIGWQVKAAENTVTHVLRKDTTEPANVVRAVVNQITVGSWTI